MAKDQQGPAKPAPNYKYTVDGKKRESSEPSMTGAAIKVSAEVDPTFSLYLEGKGQDADQMIGDTQTVDLSKPGNETFYTAPPSNYGETW